MEILGLDGFKTNLLIRRTTRGRVILLSSISTFFIILILNGMMLLFNSEKYFELCSLKLSFNIINFNFVFILTNILYSYYLYVEATIQYKKRKYYYVVDKNEYKSIMTLPLSIIFGILVAFTFIFTIFNYFESTDLKDSYESKLFQDTVYTRIDAEEKLFIDQFYHRTKDGSRWELINKQMTDEERERIISIFLRKEFDLFIPSVYISSNKPQDLLFFLVVTILFVVYFNKLVRRTFVFSLIMNEKIDKKTRNVNFEIFSSKLNKTDLFFIVFRISNINEASTRLKMSKKSIIAKVMKQLKSNIKKTDFLMNLKVEKGLVGYLMANDEQAVNSIAQKMKFFMESLTFKNVKADLVINYLVEDVKLNDDIIGKNDLIIFADKI